MRVAVALALAVALAPAQVVGAGLPALPSNLSVPAGQRAFFAGHAFGTQNYICLPSATGVAWTFFGPQATLYGSDQAQSVTHFLSANPVENNALRATWQHSRDSSAVWAVAVANSSDAAYVRSSSIPWLLLRVVGAQLGPASGSGTLNSAQYIHRINTSGGLAPATGCSGPADVGTKQFVPYEADYVFYQDEAVGK